jgi:hypothetical protein
MKRIFVIAALATFATAAQAQTADSNAAASSTVTTTVPATGAPGQSTATLNPEAAAGKTWSLSAVSQTEVATSSLNYSNNKDKSLDVINYMGIGYKVNKANSLGFRQYFSYSHDGEAQKTTSEMSYPVLTYTKTFDGIAKTDPISAMFWYYIPATETDVKAHNNGILRADVEFVWTLTPKWAVSYYMNPRQSLVPNQIDVVVADTPKTIFPKTTLVHWGSLYYNVSDTHTYYLNVGMRDDWKTKSDFETANEQYLVNLGASYALFGGKLILNPEIDYATPLGQTSSFATATTYSEDYVSYVMTVALAF